MNFINTIYGKGQIIMSDKCNILVILLDIPKYHNQYFAVYLNELK
jgi:hypothetical protein